MGKCVICSGQCRQKYCHEHRKIGLTCVTCGKAFQVYRTAYDKRRRTNPDLLPHCSITCSRIGRAVRGGETSHNLPPLAPDPRILSAWQEGNSEIKIYYPPFRAMGWESEFIDKGPYEVLELYRTLLTILMLIGRGEVIEDDTSTVCRDSEGVD